jgi:hypothetical protein
MNKLFLLKADFKDLNRGPELKFFCADCALIEGLLSYYPHLRKELEVTYVDFQRPRPAIVDLIGEENQSCPVLILDNGNFINEPRLIIDYFIKHYNIGLVH